MIQNKIIKFGDNIDTDQIIPAQFLRLESIQAMVHYTFMHDANFTENFKRGYILVGGENFGCGSSREQAPAVLRELGVAAIVAKSFARIFYRNGINLGIPLIQCACIDEFSNLDEISISLREGEIVNLTTNCIYSFQAIPSFLMDILGDGGIISHKEKQSNIKQ